MMEVIDWYIAAFSDVVGTLDSMFIVAGVSLFAFTVALFLIIAFINQIVKRGN